MPKTSKKNVSSKSPKKTVSVVEVPTSVKVEPTSSSTKNVFKYKYQILVILGVLLLAVLPGAYFHNKYQNSLKTDEKTEEMNKEETQALVEEVSDHALLPTDEEPTVATVSDVTKLESQAFFVDAKNGDKVLVYSKAKKVVLYRPSLDRIINMTPLNIESGGGGSSSETNVQ